MKILGWVLLVGWLIYSIPVGWAHVGKMIIEDPLTGVPYAIGWLLILALAIWLIRRKPKKGRGVAKRE
jgi:hypothetical protein